MTLFGRLLGVVALTAALLTALLAGPVAAQSNPPASPSGHQRLVAYVASVVGVTPAVLRQDLQAGQTLLQIAGSKYPSADALATALLAPVKTKLDEAVSANKLTAARAAAIYRTLHARVAQLVVTPHPSLAALFHGVRGAGHGGTRAHLGRVGVDLLNTLATTCKTTTAALRTALQAGGKTILAICQTTNPAITQASLVDALIAPLKARLDAAVTANKITAAQETAFLARERTFLNKLVTTTIPAGGFHHR